MRGDYTSGIDASYNKREGKMTVEEIVKEYLDKNDYDGLWGEECACERNDLFPCGESRSDCRAGYRSPCDCDDEHEFHIGPKKE